MKVSEAIERIDAQKHNTFSTAEKIAWLSELDGRVKLEIHDTHEGFDEEPFPGYGPEDTQQVLLVGAPFEELYLHYLESRMDYRTGEAARCANALAHFDNVWKAYRNYVNQTHRPKGVTIRFF